MIHYKSICTIFVAVCIASVHTRKPVFSQILLQDNDSVTVSTFFNPSCPLRDIYSEEEVAEINALKKEWNSAFIAAAGSITPEIVDRARKQQEETALEMLQSIKNVSPEKFVKTVWWLNRRTLEAECGNSGKQFDSSFLTTDSLKEELKITTRQSTTIERLYEKHSKRMADQEREFTKELTRAWKHHFDGLMHQLVPAQIGTVRDLISEPYWELYVSESTQSQFSQLSDRLADYNRLPVSFEKEGDLERVDPTTRTLLGSSGVLREIGLSNSVIDRVRTVVSGKLGLLTRDNESQRKLIDDLLLGHGSLPKLFIELTTENERERFLQIVLQANLESWETFGILNPKMVTHLEITPSQVSALQKECRSFEEKLEAIGKNHSQVVSEYSKEYVEEVSKRLTEKQQSEYFRIVGVDVRSEF